MTDDAPPGDALTRLPGRWMTRRYVLALGAVATLLCAAGFLFHLLIAQNAALLDLVNASGRQRMLSQQATLHVLRLTAARDEATRSAARDDLSGTIKLLRTGHDRLSTAEDAAGLSTRLNALYFGGPQSVDAQFGAFMGDLERIVDLPAGSAERALVDDILQRGPGSLLTALDRAVDAYQAHGEQGARRLQAWAVAALAGIVVVLAAMAWLVFRPMVRCVENQVQQVLRVSGDLRRARDGLEDEVARRTHDLAVARDAAEQASRAKSRFLASVGHDLLQPVKALGMFVTVLERSCQPGRAAGSAFPMGAAETLIDLRMALTSISGLLMGLLDFSRAENGVLEASRCPVVVAPVLEQLATEYAPMALAQEVSLRVIVSRAMVESDPVLLERILRNLLVNALRYTTRGGVLIGCRRRGDRLRMEVHDTGPGLADDQRETIYRAFSRGPDEARSADRHEALGLGLAIVSELARILGHSTGVVSTPGRGSVFWVEVPIIQTASRRVVESSEGRPSADPIPTA